MKKKTETNKAKTKKVKTTKTNTKRMIAILLLSLAAILVAGVIFCAAYVGRVRGDGVDVSLFELDMVKSTSNVYYFDGKEWVEWEEERILGERSFVFAPLSEIPKHLQDAFVAIEDKRFYKHNGVDLYRTLGAMANYVLNFDSRFGGSTITQQLIKNVTGENEVSIERKVREIVWAIELEGKMEKERILESYLNVINFSDGCYGVGSAARRYFSKSVSELSLIECASLAAIINNPSYYNPINHPENNAERRDTILIEMLEQGMISESEFEESYGKELQLFPDDSTVHSGIHSWYVDMVIDDVITDLASTHKMTREDASMLVFGGGLDIYIPIDRNIQSIMEEYYENTANFCSGEGAQSSMIIIDTKNGDILGVVGAIGEKTGNRVQNYATDTLRPPGSTIKPLSVYAPALERGIITYGSVYDDVPYEFLKNGDKLTPWPKNANGVYHGLSTMSYAMANSTNTVPLQILDEIGLSHSFYFLRDYLHLNDLIERGEGGITDMDLAPLALGQLNWGVRVRDITAAYSIFADNGIYHAPRSYLFVKDSFGNTLLERGEVSERVISDGNAEIMTKLLQDVVFGGTASGLTVKNKVAIAAKTGTTQDNKDRWCIAYTPSLLCGVWYGYEYPREIPRAEKDHFINALDTVLTRIYSCSARSSIEDRAFEESAGLIAVNYCMDSGGIPTEACINDARSSRVKLGYFVKGTEPKTLCKTHILVDYDLVCGGIANIFTPEEHIKKVGLISVERSFPVQIIVSDAQYVYRDLPAGITPSFKENEPFFAPMQSEREKRYFGISAGKTQFNRLSTAHLTPSDVLFNTNLMRKRNR